MYINSQIKKKELWTLYWMPSST